MLARFESRNLILTPQNEIEAMALELWASKSEIEHDTHFSFKNIVIEPSPPKFSSSLQAAQNIVS